LRGGDNLYNYLPNPLRGIDPLGLYNAEKCASIERRIKNLQDEIWNKRYPDLASNPNNLPYKAFPGSALRDTVQGHAILLTIALRNLDNAWKEWHDNGCDNPPPPPPAECNETTKTAAKFVVAAVIGYVAYKIVRAGVVSIFATPVGGALSLAVP
jgi:hypothetical protein